MKTLPLLLLLSLLACTSRPYNYPEATLENTTLLVEQAQLDVVRVMAKTIMLNCKQNRRFWKKRLEEKDLTPEDRKKCEKYLTEVDMMELGMMQSLETLDLREKELYEQQRPINNVR